MSTFVDGPKDTVSHVLQTFVGSSTVEPPLLTNDDADPASSFCSTNQPTESRRTSAGASTSAIDLTTSPRRNTRPDSVDVKPVADEVRPVARHCISSDEERLVNGRYKTPADAVPIPNPMSSTYNVKPGAGSSFRPVNNIDANKGVGSRTPKTYGHGKARAGTHFLDHDSVDPETTRSHELASSRNPRSTKRRKIEHAYTASAPQPVDIDLTHNDSEARSHTKKPIPHTDLIASRLSVGPGYTANTGTASTGISAFESTEFLANAHRRRSRNPTFQVSPSQTSPTATGDGRLRSSPTLSLEGGSASSGSRTARQLQFDSFQQGISSKTRSTSVEGPEIRSRHFASNMTKMDKEPLRGDLKVQRDATKRQLHNLRDEFRRADAERISDDEDPLHVAKPQAVRRNVTSSKRAKTASERKEGALGSQGLGLEFARTHEIEEIGPHLSVRNGIENTFRVVGPKSKIGDSIVTKFDIPLSRVTIAQTDNVSRIRLSGSQDTKNRIQYTFDLEFTKQAELARFQHVVANSITAKQVKTKTQDYMKSVFSKPLLSSKKDPSAPVAEQESAHLPLDVQTAERFSQRQGLLSRLQKQDLNERMNANPRKMPESDSKTRNGDVQTLLRPKRMTRGNKSNYLGDEEDIVGEAFKYSVVVGLGTPWQRQLTYGSGRRRAVIDFDDLERLDEGEFLNDQLIDFYMLYLFNKMNVPADKVYIFNTHFFSTLTRKVPGQKASINYSAVARWTAREDIFSYDYIVVPINQDVHWYLAIIFNVSNISRKPAIEELKEKPPEASTSAAPIDTPSPALAAPEGITIRARDQNNDITIILDEEQSNIDLVDADAYVPGPEKEVLNGEGHTRDSPASETARMGKLTIDDPAPKGILPRGTSSPASRKTKRKFGPPVRKWDPEEPTIVILDSLGGGARSQAVRVLKDYILEEGREKRSMEANITQNAYYAKSTQIPMQENFSDCGVYLLGFAQKFFEGPSRFKDRLLEGEMRVDTDWPDMPMPEMRNTMREILFKLHTEQEEERSRAKAEKRGKTTAVTSAPKTTTVPMTKDLPTETDSDRPKKKTVSEPNLGASGSSTRGDRATSNASTIKPEMRVEAVREPSKPRLASPFQPQPATKRDSDSPTLDRPIKVDGSPEPLQMDESLTNAELPKIEQTSPLSISRKSPSVVISSPFRTSPLKQFSDLSAGNGHGVQSGLGCEVSSPPRQKRTLDQPAGVMLTEETGNASGRSLLRTARSPRAAKSNRQHAANTSSNLSSATAATSFSTRKPPNTSRGSSTDPIPIEDSQDTMAASSPKRKKPVFTAKDDLDTIVVTAPTPKLQNVRQSPDLQRRHRRSLLEQTEVPDSIYPEHVAKSVETAFPGDELDSQLQQAQQVGTQGDESDVEGSSSRSQTPQITDKKSTVSDTPSEQRMSPVPAGLWSATPRSPL